MYSAEINETFVDGLLIQSITAPPLLSYYDPDRPIR